MKKLLLAACLAALAPQTAFAYAYRVCLGEKIRWSSPTQTMRPSTASFPAGPWENGVRQTINWFNMNPSTFWYNISMTPTVGRSNGRNEIWIGNNSNVGAGASAVAYSSWNCYWLFGDHVHLTEVDVLYNFEAASFTADVYNKASLLGYGGSRLGLDSVGAHELGHSIGLLHINSKYNVMGLAWEHVWVNGISPQAYIGEDAANGAVFLYSARSTYQDVAVSHWKFHSPSGEYSDHTRTVVYDNNGGVLPAVTINSEPGHVVSRGQRVLVEFTYENNGASPKSNVPVGYYLSNNDLISTSDRKIGTRTITVTRDSPSTQTFDVVVPADIAPGNYWIGVIIDDTNVVGETLETNNATYIPVRVQ